MLSIDLITAVDSGDLDLYDTTLMDSTPLYKVFLSDSHKSLRCQQVKNVTKFSRRRKRNFECWRNGKRARESSSLKITIILSGIRLVGRTGAGLTRKTKKVTPSAGASNNNSNKTTTTTATLCDRVHFRRTKPV